MPALIRGSSCMALAVAAPPMEKPNMPTRARFRSPARPRGRAWRSTSGLCPALSAVISLRTNRTSASRTAVASVLTASLSGGRMLTSTWPSGNCTSPASWVWSMVTTAYPWLARSSTSAVSLLRSILDPGENSTTGRRPAPRCALVAVGQRQPDQGRRNVHALEEVGRGGRRQPGSLRVTGSVAGRIPDADHQLAYRMGRDPRVAAGGGGQGQGGHADAVRAGGGRQRQL